MRIGNEGLLSLSSSLNQVPRSQCNIICPGMVMLSQIMHVQPARDGRIWCSSIRTPDLDAGGLGAGGLADGVTLRSSHRCLRGCLRQPDSTSTAFIGFPCGRMLVVLTLCLQGSSFPGPAVP